MARASYKNALRAKGIKSLARLSPASLRSSLTKKAPTIDATEMAMRERMP